MLSFFHQAYYTRATAKGEKDEKLTIRDVADIAIVAAIYVVLTVTPPLNAISYGAYQFHYFRNDELYGFYNPKYIIGSYYRFV